VVPIVATAGGTSPGRERPCCADRKKGSGAVSPVAIVWPCPAAVDAYAAAGRDLRSRARCGVSHVLLPAFTLAWRLEVAETIGSVAMELGGQAVTPQAGAGRVRANCDRRRVPPGREPARMGPAGRVAVRLSGDRRQADRRQHSLALVRGRQAAFDASYPAMTPRNQDAVEHKEQEQVALHRWAVIAEAAGETLTARERGRWSARSPSGRTRRVVPPLFAGHGRPLAAGLASGRAGGTDARAPGGHRDGACPPGAVRRGGGAAAGAARPLRGRS
jgi:hypothetical protein